MFSFMLYAQGSVAAAAAVVVLIAAAVVVLVAAAAVFIGEDYYKDNKENPVVVSVKHPFSLLSHLPIYIMRNGKNGYRLIFLSMWSELWRAEAGISQVCPAA